MCKEQLLNKTYLFDWGDTLMVDFPDQEGKMCDWSRVAAMRNAYQTLKSIAAKSQIYIATNAADSTESEIQAAFEKVDLAQFISGYFCRANLGLSKGSKAFYFKIAEKLDLQPSSMIMVGDSLERDIVPAIEAGLDVIWFNHKNKASPLSLQPKQIRELSELCT
jgi:FMN phosphatase YigB (HAD superfamily)